MLSRLHSQKAHARHYLSNIAPCWCWSRFQMRDIYPFIHYLYLLIPVYGATAICWSLSQLPLSKKQGYTLDRSASTVAPTHPHMLKYWKNEFVGQNKNHLRDLSREKVNNFSSTQIECNPVKQVHTWNKLSETSCNKKWKYSTASPQLTFTLDFSSVPCSRQRSGYKNTGTTFIPHPSQICVLDKVCIGLCQVCQVEPVDCTYIALSRHHHGAPKALYWSFSFTHSHTHTHTLINWFLGGSQWGFSCQCDFCCVEH